MLGLLGQFREGEGLVYLADELELLELGHGVSVLAGREMVVQRPFYAVG